MNVIVANKCRDKLAELDVDIIKSINGEFSADEIVQSFSNFFFNRMFLDITAISDYANVNNLKKLSIGLDVSKIILLLSDDPVVNTSTYISSLISMGIYNFAHSISEVQYLYDNPNSYRDVAHLQKINEVSLENTNSSSPSTSLNTNQRVESNVRVVGFKNFTNHAGATSLIYMLKKQLSKHYYVVALEVNKRDFMFFNDKDMVSCSANDLRRFILKYQDANVILVDLNDCDNTMAHSLCNDVIYLMEASTLMINKSILLDQKCFEKLYGENVVLNRSLLTSKDVRQLQSEANLSFFATLPPLNDRVDNGDVLFPFLEQLGLYRLVDD